MFWGKKCIRLSQTLLKPWPTKFLNLKYNQIKYPTILYYLKYRYITKTKEAVILVGGILNNLDKRPSDSALGQTCSSPFFCYNFPFASFLWSVSSLYPISNISNVNIKSSTNLPKGSNMSWTLGLPLFF